MSAVVSAARLFHDYWCMYVSDLPTVPLLAGPPRFWRDSPAFLPDVPLNHGNVPLFVRSRIFFVLRAQFVPVPRCPDVNANHPIERNYGNSVRFLAKINCIVHDWIIMSVRYQMVPRPNRRVIVESMLMPDLYLNPAGCCDFVSIMAASGNGCKRVKQTPQTPKRKVKFNTELAETYPCQRIQTLFPRASSV